MMKEMERHLVYDIIPFWIKLIDRENGGYYGYVGYDLELDKKAVKGSILNSRILWFFSNAYLLLGDESLLEYAKHSFKFLKEKCIDKENGGLYWSLKYNGDVEDSTKHTYAQAFAVYGLASYYDASKDEKALDLAMTLVDLIEEKCTDEYGYLEAFDREFNPVENDKLSENNIIAEKTMNTLLHIFEAYTELYRVSGDKEIEKKLKEMLDVFADKIYNSEIGRLEVFFDKKFNSLIDLYSYGHDIEAAWLIDRGCEVLGDADYKAKMSPITKQITENIYSRAYVNHSLLNEAENGVNDTKRVWWVQAEAVVGFLNGYEKNDDDKYLKGAEDIWDYIKEYVIDKRDNSEWFSQVDENNKPIEIPIVDEWKCPYHNGRMCIEVIRRMSK